MPPGAEARRLHIQRNVGEFAGLLGRACPAQVYEYVDAEGGVGSDSKVEEVTASGKKFVINSQVRRFAIGCLASTFLSIAYTLTFVSSIGVDLAGCRALSLRIVSIASCATSRCRRKISPGQSPKVGGGRNIVRFKPPDDSLRGPSVVPDLAADRRSLLPSVDMTSYIM